MSVALLTISEISSLFERLAESVQSAFGPKGGAVLIRKISPRESYITKNGIKILSTLEGEHPLYKMILGTLKTHVTSVGDGAKTAILILRNFFRKLTNERSNQEKRLRWISQLVRFRNESLPEIHRKLREKSFPSSDHRYIFQSFLSTRFKSRICAILVDLLCQFIEKLEVGESKSEEFASKSLEIFDEPVTKSRIEPGFLIRGGDSTIVHDSDPYQQPSKFLIWSLTNEEEEEEDRIEAVIDTSHRNALRKICDFIDWEGRKFESFVSRLVESGVSLLVCCGPLPDFARSICGVQKMSFIEYVPLEEANQLARQAEILLWTMSNDIEDLFLGKMNSFSKVFLGKDLYIRINLTSSSVLHPVICGPNKSLTQEYSRACHQALLLLDLNEDDGRVIKAGGLFELEVAELLKSLDGNEISDALAKSIYEHYTDCRGDGFQKVEVLEAKIRTLDCVCRIAEDCLRIEQILTVKKLNK